MNEDGECLEEVFQEACRHFWEYLGEKEGRLGVGGSEAVTGVLKEVRGQLAGRLDEVQ